MSTGRHHELHIYTMCHSVATKLISLTTEPVSVIHCHYLSVDDSLYGVHPVLQTTKDSRFFSSNMFSPVLRMNKGFQKQLVYIFVIQQVMFLGVCILAPNVASSASHSHICLCIVSGCCTHLQHMLYDTFSVTTDITNFVFKHVALFLNKCYFAAGR
jgi:hypothetical protein